MADEVKDPSIVEATAAAPDEPKADKAGKDNKRPDRLLYGGRVFVRDSLLGVDGADDTTWSHSREVASARAFLDFRPNKRLKMVLEIEFGDGDADLKDVYLRYRPTSAFGIRAGHFKKPVSFIGLESNWSLPRIDRGLLSDYPVDLPFAGGRGYGVALELAPGGALDPEVTLTTMQSEAGGALDVTDNVNQDVYGRVEIGPVPELRLAVAGGWVGVARTATNPATYGHRSFGSVEARLETKHVRAWVEAMAGQNLTRYERNNLHGGFVAGRALVAGHLEGALGLRAIEPYLAVSLIDPKTDGDDDALTEVSGGASFWISKNLRLQAEAGRMIASDASDLVDSTLVRLQLAAAFEGETELH